MNENCMQNHCGACCGGACPMRGDALTPREAALLRELGMLAFLPFAAGEDGQPVYRSREADTVYDREILTLRQKGLIQADADLPLTGFDYSAYPDCPVHGSMALTLAGQEALDDLEYRQDVE